MDNAEICLIVRRFTIGGLERVVIVLANALTASGRRVHLVVLDAAGLSAMLSELDERVAVHVLRGGPQERLARLRRLVHNRVAHLHLADGRIHPRLRWALRAHPAVFVTYHSDYTPVRNWLTNRIDRAITGRSRGVVAVSNAVREFCVHRVGLPDALVSVIENAVPEPRESPVSIRRDGCFTLVALATVHPHKNYPGLVAGLARARQQGQDVRLRVIGDGPAMADALGAAVRLGVRPHIEWYGGLWQASIVNALLMTSDAFVSASRNEGLPMSVLEGLRHGLPMLLSDIPPHREAAGDAAVYFPSEDPDQFADRLAELMAPGGSEKRAEEARRRAALFDPAQFTRRHLAMYATAGATGAEGQ